MRKLNSAVERFALRHPNFGLPNALLFTDARGLIGLLSFVYSSFIANFESIEFSVPGHMDLTALLPELSSMEYIPVLNGMARAVNAETLLKPLALPRAGTTGWSVPPRPPKSPWTPGTSRSFSGAPGSPAALS